MTAAHFLAWSPYFEAALIGVAALGLFATLHARRRRPPAHAEVPEAEIRTRKLLWALLLAAALARLLCHDAANEPRWWFAERSVFEIDRTLREGRFGPAFGELLQRSQADYLHESAAMMPIAAAVQSVLGPSVPIVTIVGGIWGTATVLLAFALGRTLRSGLFGLLFAGCVAAAPLQIAWSRLGGIQIGAGAHVLLVLWLAALAGKRRSVPLALLTGAAAWAGLYHYYAARVAIPLGGLLLLGELLRARAGKARSALVLGAFVLSFAALQVSVHGAGAWRVLWPAYSGYVGTSDEGSLTELARHAFTSARDEAPRVIRAYFWAKRSTSPTLAGERLVPAPERSALTPGAAAGGLALVPIAALALLGVLVAIRHARRDWPWLALAAAGFLIPCLSALTARRLLLFDLGMCALAARGLLALLASAQRSGVSASRLAAAATALLVLLTAYSFGALRALAGTLPPNHGAAIPFGESGFGDGRTCLACIEAARHWQREIEAGAFVVLVDGDLDRETLTIPGGLPLYGRLAALAARRPDSFAELYPAVRNFDWPLVSRRLYDAERLDYAAYLAERIGAAQHTSVVWHFSEPTQWEEMLIQRLLAAGGQREPLPHFPVEPLWRTGEGARRGAVVRILWGRRNPALGVLRRLARSEPEAGACLRFDVPRREAIGIQPTLLASTLESGPPRDWVVASWHDARWRGRTFPVPDASALELEAASGSPRTLRALQSNGNSVAIDLLRGERREAPSPQLAPVGRDCGAWLGGAWWVVNPITGRLATSRSVPVALPAGRWVGLAAAGPERLLLASADQVLSLLDTVSGEILTSFPAHVPPSQRLGFAECSLVLRGEEWLGTFDAMRSLLFAYDLEGESLGTLRMDRPLQLGTHNLLAARAVGRDLGLGQSGYLDTFTLTQVPDCSARSPERSLDRSWKRGVHRSREHGLGRSRDRLAR